MVGPSISTGSVIITRWSRSAATGACTWTGGTPAELWRDYWEVATDTGLLCVLYRDLLAEGWFLERVYAMRSRMSSCTRTVASRCWMGRPRPRRCWIAPPSWAWRRWRSPTTMACTPPCALAWPPSERGIHPIIGAELTLEDERHLVLLAENRRGLPQPLLADQPRAAGRHEKERARLAWAHLPGQHRGADRPHRLPAGRAGGAAPGRGPRRSAPPRAGELRELFGPGRLYVELQHHLRPDDDALVGDLADLAREARLPLVATNNVHYARREGHRLQDVLTAIRHNQPVARMPQPALYPNSEYYLKSAAEMAALFADYPEALAQHARDRRALPGGPGFPRRRRMPPVPETLRRRPDERLAALCAAGLPRCYPRTTAAAWSTAGATS